MALFKWFKKDNQKNRLVNSDVNDLTMENKSVLQSTQFVQFQTKFQESLRLKDISSLASALHVRQQATEMVKNEPALYCVGKHNEMILEYNHIGHGMEARNSAIESLKYEEQYKNIALALFPMFRSNFYQESMEYMGDASVSYEESLYYRSKLKEEFPTDINKRRYQEIKELQSKYSRWFSAQRVIVGTFYSRVNPELDKGKYAAGISMLDVILTNAQNSSYKLDYEEYVDILDDICATAVQLLMQKVAVRHQLKIGEYEAKELGCIMEKPIRYLTDFYPDCLPKDKELFGNHFKSWKLIPWINEVSGWEKLSPFFT